MAIPGLKAQFDVRAKVRIGVKKKTQGGKEYPSAVDYFVCDDPEFVALYGEKPRELRVILPFASASDAFSTGLEMWRGEMLACYSKGDTVLVNGQPQAVAYRKQTIRSGGKDVDLLAGELIVGEPMGKGKERTPIACMFRNCKFFKSEKKDCRPLGRLQFFLEGGRTDAVLQLDTKSWNSIERIEATLGAAAAKGDLRGRVFVLAVHIEKKGNQQYPLLSLTEADVVVNDETDFAQAVELVDLRISVEGGEAGAIRPALAAALDLTNPGWRDNAALIQRLRDVGPLEAAKGLLSRYGL